MFRLSAFVIFCMIQCQVFGMDLWLNENNNLKGDYIKLSQLLESDQHRQRFSSVFLGKNSENRRISLKYIQSRLAKGGFLTVKVKLRSGAAAVIVKRSFGEDGSKKVSSQISPTTMSSGIDVEPAMQSAGEKSLTPKVFKYVSVKSTLRRGELLLDSDLEIVEKKRIINGATVSLEEVLGKRLTKTLKSGSVILRDYIDVPPIVKKGDTVNVIYKSAQIEITGIGRATESGVVGDIIQVKRKRDLVACKILGKNKVQVVNI